MVDIIGSFRVNKVKWTSGNIQYSLLFLKDRMLFAKVGGQFADQGGLVGAVGSAFGGAIGAAIGDVIGRASEKRDAKVKSLMDMKIEEILTMDKDNFQIRYSDISKVEMKTSLLSITSPRVGWMKIAGTRQESIDIAANQNFDECEKIVRFALHSKLAK